MTIPTESGEEARPGPSVYRLLLWAGLAVVVVEFIVRAGLRIWIDGSDLATQYAGAIAWRQGKNPYDMAVLADLFLAQGGSADVVPKPGITPSVYPPLSFMLLSPLSLMPWGAAKATVGLANIAAVVLFLWAVLRHFGRDWKTEYRIAFAIFVFGFAPLHTGISKGQLVPVALAGMLFAWIAARERRYGQAGLLLGLATCLKPQLVGVLVLLFVMRGLWRAAAITVGIVAAAGVLSFAMLLRSGIGWLADWRYNLQQPIHSAGWDNPSRVQMLNSQVLLSFLFGDGAPWSLLVGAAILACLVWLFVQRLRFADREEPLVLSLLLLLDLLAVYHRFYDGAVLLVFAIVVFDWLRHGERRRGIAGLVCLTVFLAPGAVIIQQLVDAGRIPASGGIVLSLALCHQIIALVVATVLVALSLAERVEMSRADTPG